MAVTCQSEIKVLPHNSKSDMPLVSVFYDFSFRVSQLCDMEIRENYMCAMRLCAIKEKSSFCVSLVLSVHARSRI